ncbi:MAG TPA: VacJ family lipoprotein [Allosphingosinicella sp.]|jgi:phospholipid-binding lipoprotein MlaA
MKTLLILLAAALPLAGCATTRTGGESAGRDPYEGFNRGVWAFNNGVDKVAIKPATKVYRAVAPVPARRGISRVFSNLGEPLNFVNNLLQGKPGRAINSLGRFVVNSTIGVGGLADHATDLGLKPTPEDFGQTFARHGARNSPYLVLPLLGPSTVRDGIGTAVQFALDPTQVGLKEAGVSSTGRYAVTGTRLLDTRSQLIEGGVDALLKSAADPYATARSAYFQRRAAQIADRENKDPEPGFDELAAALDEAAELNGEGTKLALELPADDQVLPVRPAAKRKSPGSGNR